MTGRWVPSSTHGGHRLFRARKVEELSIGQFSGPDMVLALDLSPSRGMGV